MLTGTVGFPHCSASLFNLFAPLLFMKKSAHFFILAAFLAGAALGYFFLFPSLKQDSSSVSSTKSPHEDERAPDFKQIRDNRQNSQPQSPGDTLDAYLKKYAGFSPQETRAELERLLKEQKNKQNSAIHYLALKLAYQSPEEAKRILDDKNNPDRKALYSTLLEGWAEKDFQGAMDYLLTHKIESSDPVGNFNILTKNLVFKDTDKALKWLSTLTPGKRETALKIMSDAFPKHLPEKMSDFMATLTRSEQLDNRVMLTNWAATDWDAFKIWANTLKKNEQDYILPLALKGLSRTDLAKATEKMQELGNNLDRKIAESIVSGMDYDERTQGKALDWALENKDYFSDPLSVIQTTVSRSCFFEQPKLTKKVLEMPEGELKDAALAGLVDGPTTRRYSYDYVGDHRRTSSQYIALLELAEKIGDPQKRSQTTVSCVNIWLDENPEKARQWITEKSNLSARMKQKLIKKCDGRQKEISAK